MSQLNGPRPTRPAAADLMVLAGQAGSLLQTRSAADAIENERGGGSSDSSGPEAASRTSSLQRRARARTRKAMGTVLVSTDATKVAAAMSSLEKTSVQPSTARAYREQVGLFVRHGDKSGTRLVEGAQVDVNLVAYMDVLYFQGNHSWRGQRLMAGLMFADGGSSKRGSRSLPRAWRALRGWKLLTPGRSRQPQPWCFWMGVAAILSRMGHTDMGVCIIIRVCCYLRPSGGVGLRNCDLQPPARGAVELWSLLSFREENPERSKT